MIRNGIPSRLPKAEMSYFDLVPSCGRPGIHNFQGERQVLPMKVASAPAFMKNRATVDVGTSRMVTPCDTSLVHKVLRRAPVPSAGGLVPPTGYARKQGLGLAYLKEKPLNVPIMPQAGFYNVVVNNSLGKVKG